MQAHGAGECAAFHVAPEAFEFFGQKGVSHALDHLLDNRPFVQVGSDVMRGGADDFYAALIRLMIGARALEAGQK